MTRIAAAGVLAVIVAGCAGFGVPDCGSDWYEIGMRDGRLGASSQVERYATTCPNLDRKRYEEGHAVGTAARPRLPIV